MTGRDVPRLTDYIDHVAESIGRIGRYIDGDDEQALLADSMLQDAVIRNLEIIGEAARNVEKRFRNLPVSTPRCRGRWHTKCATYWRMVISP